MLLSAPCTREGKEVLGATRHCLCLEFCPIQNAQMLSAVVQIAANGKH